MSDATKPFSAGTLPVKEFFSLDLRSLALFRVGLGLMLVIDWVDRLPDLAAHYSDKGIVPRGTVSGIQPLSIHIFSGEVWFQAALAFVALVAAIALFVGWRTPLACLVSWFLLVSVHGRTPSVMQGGDHLIRMICFWGIFLPLGARYSFDSARGGTQTPSPPLLSVASFAYVAQIVIVYFFAAIWKWSDEWRFSGNAVYEALQVEPFTTRVGQLLLLSPETLRLLTHATLWLEMLGPVLLFLPFNVGLQRLIAVSLFTLFHLGLALTLELGNFPWVCIVAWLALLPTSFWDRVVASIPSPGAGLTLAYDSQSSWARDWTAGLLSWLFLWQTKHVPGKGTWSVSQGEKQLTGPEALSALAAASPIYSRLAPLCHTAPGRWLATLPARPWHAALAWRAILGLLAAACMAQAFADVGWVLLLILLLGVAALILEGALEILVEWLKSQKTEGQPAGPGRPAWTPPGGYVVNAVLLALLVYVVLFNWRNYGSYRAASFNEPPQAQVEWNAVLPYPNLAFGQAIGIDQGWGLFAPRPGRLSGWYFIVGIRADGSRIDLLDGGKIINDFDPRSKPAVPSASFPNGRWRKIVMHTSGFDYDNPGGTVRGGDLRNTHAFPHLLEGFCRYYARDWNERHKGKEQIVAVQIIYWKEETHAPDEKAPPPVRMPLVHYDLLNGMDRFVFYPNPLPAKPGQP